MQKQQSQVSKMRSLRPSYPSSFCSSPPLPPTPRLSPCSTPSPTPIKDGSLTPPPFSMPLAISTAPPNTAAPPAVLAPCLNWIPRAMNRCCTASPEPGRRGSRGRAHRRSRRQFIWHHSLWRHRRRLRHRVQARSHGPTHLPRQLHFNPDGADPHGSLVGDPQGNGYGTTQYGGTAGGYGTVFKVDVAGNESLLHSFAGTPDGEDPQAGLYRDAAGNLYGTTQYGGTAGGYGTVFKLALNGDITLLHSFSGTPDGENPYAALTADSHGNGYGTTKYGGTAAATAPCSR